MAVPSSDGPRQFGQDSAAAGVAATAMPKTKAGSITQDGCTKGLILCDMAENA
jgi:hypothetical protein